MFISMPDDKRSNKILLRKKKRKKARVNKMQNK